MTNSTINTATYSSFRPTELYAKVLKARKEDGEQFFSEFHDNFVDIKCPACESDSSEIIFYKYGFTHRICLSCGTIYVSPRPTDEFLSKYYNEFSAPKIWTEILINSEITRKKVQYQPRVDYILSKLKGKSKNSIAVDLGAGSGAFALCLKETNYFSDVIALDVSSDCVAVCKKSGLTAILGSVDDLQDNSCDLICMNDLIEHLFDPISFLRHCYRKLRKGGVISIATPNGRGFDFILLKSETGNITPPEHIQYFNPKSMNRLLTMVGFVDLDITTPGILDVSMINEKIKAGTHFNDNQWIEYLIKSSDESVLNNFQKFIAENLLSSHMVAIGRKE